ncbi:MAG: hypothetical protein ACPG34_06470 [Poseidonia sp.]
MKPTTRLLTAVLLTSMMMLSGCLGTGTGDDTEDGGGGFDVYTWTIIKLGAGNWRVLASFQNFA